MKKLALVSLLLLQISCTNNGTDSGNPRVALKLSNFTALSSEMMPASVQEISMCFKRLRFKTFGETTAADPSLDEDNVDLTLGRVTLSSTGAELTHVFVPPGTYTRIEFDLERDCDGTPTPSATVDNDNDGGTPFQSNDRITIKFDGSVEVTGNMDLELMIGQLINAADAVTSNADIKTQLEAASGSF